MVATISTRQQVNKKLTNFLIFEKIILPSSTASTIVENRSSVRIISEASFATPVPRIPIATPISAPFNAGPSFTPSPVIATIFPFERRDFTI